MQVSSSKGTKEVNHGDDFTSACKETEVTYQIKGLLIAKSSSQGRMSELRTERNRKLQIKLDDAKNIISPLIHFTFQRKHNQSYVMFCFSIPFTNPNSKLQQKHFLEVVFISYTKRSEMNQTWPNRNGQLPRASPQVFCKHWHVSLCFWSCLVQPSIQL